MITYMDMTFCSANCSTVGCHRNKDGVYFGGGPKEAWMPVAWSDFSKACQLYQEVFDEDNK